jgi:hypothetical protein
MKKVILKNGLKHGQWFKAEINGHECIGRVSISESGNVYLCQDVMEGSGAPNKLGFPYSWSANNGSASMLKRNDVRKFKLLSRRPASFQAPLVLPNIGSYNVILRDNGETVQVGCTPVSRELYLEVGRRAGWIE